MYNCLANESPGLVVNILWIDQMDLILLKMKKCFIMGHETFIPTVRNRFHQWQQGNKFAAC